eukprot:maker-scaffold3325_size9202-snap-gene-0.0 protein:Tk02717 transcript:maker-scaffold3325_size9202-snap-gene-0.0-mRNA-1 annotation:"proton-translocating nadh-quinone chain m"
MYPLMEAGEITGFIAIIGGITAFGAATIALIQTDIKAVLAYSTISQLGYMVLGIGVGSYNAAFMHLITHAIFKACLFLSAGSVIHSVHTQEMPQMGGLRKKLPYTFIAMLFCTFAISGVPFFSGFVSKDRILGDALYWAIYGMEGAVLTAFYMFRMMFLTFFGAPKDKEIYDHCHKEKIGISNIPLLILAVFTFGFWFSGAMFGSGKFVNETITLFGTEFSFEKLVFWAMFLGFAIKVPVFPFHTWLPHAHVQAPTAVSVILAGVLLKMGTYGFLRIAFPIFPAATVEFSTIIAVLGLISVLYGAFCAMAQTDVKKLVAYSSVSHMGFVMMGLAAMTTEGMNGAVLQMFNHGTSTAMMFLMIGVLYERSHHRWIVRPDGTKGYGGLASLGYKISCVPFHMWSPDVYEGSPTPVTAFFTLVPKLAGLAIIVRTSHAFFGDTTILSQVWIGLLHIIAALTMTVGNVTAIGQSSVKRLLAFSSIGHVGMMLLGVIAMDTVGTQAILFYSLTYMFMTLVAFFITSHVADNYGSDHKMYFQGLMKKHPLMGVAMVIVLFSLAGLPPLSGFVAKYTMLAA